MELEIGNERRHQPGVAVLSLRRLWISQQLASAGIPSRHIIPQLGPTLLPAFRPPLLLDTVDMPLPLLVAILWELSRMRELTPTLALLPPTEPGLARLLALPLAISVLLADTVPTDTLGLWLRLAPQIVRRTAATPPAMVGLGPPPPELLSLPAYTLDALRALAPYGGPPAVSITEAAQQAGISRRLFCYQLAAIRAVVGVPATRRYRPPDLAEAICAALAEPILAASR